MKEFTDSVEATEFMEKIENMLMDERLTDWARETNIESTEKLATARVAYFKFLEYMYNVD
jgi:hypothetical protein